MQQDIEYALHYLERQKVNWSEVKAGLSISDLLQLLSLGRSCVSPHTTVPSNSTVSLLERALHIKNTPANPTLKNIKAIQMMVYHVALS